jgi:hypothetical protein
MKTRASLRAPRNAPAAYETETRAIYRALLLRSLRPAEAANLTAFLCGIPIGNQPWKIDEINRLLFLRELYNAGRFHPTPGA